MHFILARLSRFIGYRCPDRSVYSLSEPSGDAGGIRADDRPGRDRRAGAAVAAGKAAGGRRAPPPRRSPACRGNIVGKGAGVPGGKPGDTARRKNRNVSRRSGNLKIIKTKIKLTSALFGSVADPIGKKGERLRSGRALTRRPRLWMPGHSPAAVRRTTARRRNRPRRR